MYIGLLTAPFHDRSLEEVIRWAGENGFAALEVASGPGSPHLDPTNFTPERAKEIRNLCEQQEIRLSSLACYANLLDPDRRQRERLTAALRELINAAGQLGVEVVCTGAGMPLPGKTKMQTIEEEVPGVYGPLVKYAASRGIKIALENWFATNIQNLEHWDKIFTLVPDENFGLNFDPSHLYWQQIDYLQAVKEFGPRIFHTHAKDTTIDQARLRRVGNQASGWWRYSIPGEGGIDWAAYLAALRSGGYEGVLSIEHEDRELGVEEGFLRGLQFLSPLV
ncbi:MAG TPA: sugar phosphate isomerase/epimerase [Armatimonadetes bacterium]|nr:sugar phosphate isomerase/epimerase [Armatimonadota bacterium]